MPKKPPSAYSKKNFKKKRTPRDWFVISIYLILAIALVASTFIFMFAPESGGGGF